MKKKYAKEQLQEAIYSRKSYRKFCPTFDEETANYVRERLELYLKTWVLPNLNEVLNELSK